MHLPAMLDAHAGVQHGLISHDQLLQGGVPPQRIKDLLVAGAVEPLHRGVYRCAGSPHTWEQKLFAACLATGSLAAASHRAAAHLWGVWLPDEPPIELTVCRERCPRPAGAIIHRSLDLTPDWVTTRHGIPVTKPYRLLADLGAVSAPWHVERALDHLNAKRLITIKGARAAREALGKRGRRGVGMLGRILDQRALGEDDAESVLETRMAKLCRRYGLPSPQYQYYVVADGDMRFIDFAYPERMLAIEVDGWAHHSSFSSFQGDRVRGNQLLLLGWRVLHFTWQQVVHDAGSVARIIERALRIDPSSFLEG